MRTLCLDSAHLGQIGLFEDQELIRSITLDEKVNLSESLFPSLKTLLQDLAMEDLDAVVVQTGPGSFTSLRVAIAFVKGLALAKELKIYPVDYFSMVAHLFKAKANGDFCVVKKGKSDDFFGQFFSEEGVPQDKAYLFTPDTLKEFSKEAQLQLVGEEFPLLSQLDSSFVLNELTYTLNDMVQFAITHKPISGFELKPLYVRKTYVGTD